MNYDNEELRIIIMREYKNDTSLKGLPWKIRSPGQFKGGVIMKIAVATSDQVNADHFGRAKGFAIYQWDGDEIEFVEYIPTNINPEEKHQWHKGLSILGDCEVIIAAQAGMKAKYGIKKGQFKTS